MALHIKGDLEIEDSGVTLNDLIPVVLYENSSGTTSSFQLSDEVENYKKLEITVGRSNGGVFSTQLVDLEFIGDKVIGLNLSDNDGSNMFTYCCRISFSGKNASVAANNFRSFIDSSGVSHAQSSPVLGIFKVVGYK